MSQLTSTSEFDLEKRVQITNEVVPYDMYKALNSTLKNDFWKWVLGTVETEYDMPYGVVESYTHDDTNILWKYKYKRDITSNDVFRKVTNGYISPVYGPTDSLEPSVGNTPKEFKTYHSMNITGVVLPEFDLLLHEVYRYLDNLYPDHPDYVELLTPIEIDDSIKNAGYLLNYNINTAVMDKVVRANSNSSSDELNKEALMLKVRNLRDEAIRKKVYGTKEGFKMLGAGIWENIEVFPVGTYLPLKQTSLDELNFEKQVSTNLLSTKTKNAEYTGTAFKTIQGTKDYINNRNTSIGGRVETIFENDIYIDKYTRDIFRCTQETHKNAGGNFDGKWVNTNVRATSDNEDTNIFRMWNVDRPISSTSLKKEIKNDFLGKPNSLLHISTETFNNASYTLNNRNTYRFSVIFCPDATASQTVKFITSAENLTSTTITAKDEKTGQNIYEKISKTEVIEKKRLSANTWYILTSYIYAENTESFFEDAGVYSLSNGKINKVFDAKSFVMSTGFSSFDATCTLNNAYIYNIRLDLVNGKEPTIESLLTSRNKTQFRGAWSTGMYYYEKDIVEFNGKYYYCNFNNIASNNLSINNTTFWSAYEYPSSLSDFGAVDSLIEFNEAMGTSFSSDEYLKYTHQMLRDIDIYNPNYYKKFRLIDWDGTKSSYSKFSNLDSSFSAVSIPTMRYILAEIPVVNDIDSKILNCELNDIITSPKDDSFTNYVETVRPDTPFTQSLFNVIAEDGKTVIPVLTTTDADTGEEVHTIQTQSLNDCCTSTVYYFPSQKSLLSLNNEGYNEFLAATVEGHDYSGSLNYVKDSLGLMKKVSIGLNPYLKDSIIFDNDIMASLYDSTSNKEVWAETETKWSDSYNSGINKLSYITEENPKELEQGEASEMNLYAISDLNKGYIKFKFEEPVKSANLYNRKNIYAVIKDPATNKCVCFGGSLTTEFNEIEDPNFKYELLEGNFEIGFIPSDSDSNIIEIKNKYALDISKDYITDIYGHSDVRFFEILNKDECWKNKNIIEIYTLGSLNIFPVLNKGNFCKGSMTENEIFEPADQIEELWESIETKGLNILEIKNHTPGYSQIFTNFRNFLIKTSFKLSTRKIAENGIVKLICSSNLTSEDTKNILEVSAENEDLISTLNVGDLVFGPGVDNDDEDVFITKIVGRNIYLSSPLYVQSNEAIYTFSIRMNIKPTNIDLFESFKERIIDYGTFKKIDPFSNGFYRSENWPHSSKALLNGISDVTDFRPWNNYSSFNIVMNYIYGPNEANKKIMPSTIKFMNDLFVELNADKLLNLPTKASETNPCLMSVDILDYFTDNVKEITRASDNVNFGVNINLECDTQGFDYWENKMKSQNIDYKYTDDNIHAKFSVLPNLWKEVDNITNDDKWCIPYYAQIGTGVNDLTYVIRKEFNNLNATIWGYSLYEYNGQVKDYRFELINEDEADFINSLWDISEKRIEGEFFYKARDRHNNIIYISSNEVYDIEEDEQVFTKTNDDGTTEIVKYPYGYTHKAYEKTYAKYDEDHPNRKVYTGKVDEGRTNAIAKELEENESFLIPWLVPEGAAKEDYELKIYGAYKYRNNLDSKISYSLISYVNENGEAIGKPFYVLSTQITISDKVEDKLINTQKSYFYENKQIKILKVNTYDIADIDEADVPERVVSLYGHQDMDEQLLKEINGENFIIYNNVNTPLFEIPIGEYDIQLKYERNNEIFTTVQANFYKQSFKNLQKYLNNGEIKINASVESNNSGAFLYNLISVKDGWESQSATTGVNDLELISGLTIEYGGEWTPSKVFNSAINGNEINYPEVNVNKYLDNTLVYYFIPEERVLSDIFDKETNIVSTRTFTSNSIIFTKVYKNGAVNDITPWEYREFQACNTIDSRRTKAINNSHSETIYSLDGSSKERTGIEPTSFERVSFLDMIIARFFETTSVYDEDTVARIKESTFVYFKNAENKVWSKNHVPAWNTIQDFNASMMDVLINKCYYEYVGKVEIDFEVGSETANVINLRKQGENALKTPNGSKWVNNQQTLTSNGVTCRVFTNNGAAFNNESIRINYRTKQENGTQVNYYFNKVNLKLDVENRNFPTINIDKVIEFAKKTEAFYAQSSYYSVYWAEVTEKDDERFGTPVDTDSVKYSLTEDSVFTKISNDFKTKVRTLPEYDNTDNKLLIEDIDLLNTWYNWIEQKVQATGEDGPEKKSYYIKDLYSIIHFFKAIGNETISSTDFDSGVTYIIPTGNENVVKKLKDSFENKVLYYLVQVGGTSVPFGGTFKGLNGESCVLNPILDNKDIIGITLFEGQYVLFYFDRNKKNTSIIPIEQLSVNGYLDSEWMVFSEPSLGFNTISIIDNVISKIPLPRKSITDGSYDFNLTIDPKFIGRGYKYVNGVPNKYDDGGNEDLTKLTSFNLTKSAIKYDAANDEYYINSNEFVNGKFTEEATNFAIKFNEQKFFKNIVHSIGAYQLRPILQNNSSTKEFNPTYYAIDGQILNGNYLSADDRVLDIKEIYLRSNYNRGLESRFFNNYISLDLQLREFDISDNSLILGALATPSDRVQLYNTLSDKFNKDTFEPKELSVKNIEISKYNENLSNVKVTERYFKNNLVFIGSMNLATPNRVELPLAEDLAPEYLNALKYLSTDDILNDAQVLDIVINDDKVVKNKYFTYQGTRINQIIKISYNEYYNVLLVLTQGGDVYYQANPSFNDEEVKLSVAVNCNISQLGTIIDLEYSPEYGIVLTTLSDGLRAIYSLSMETKTVTQILNGTGHTLSIVENGFAYNDNATIKFTETTIVPDEETGLDPIVEDVRVRFKDITIRNGTLNLISDNKFEITEDFNTAPYIESHESGVYFAKDESFYFENKDSVSERIKAIFFKDGVLYIKSNIPLVNESGDYTGSYTANAYWHKVEIPAYLDSTYSEIMGMSDSEAKSFFMTAQTRVKTYFESIGTLSTAQNYVKTNFVEKSIDQIISENYTVKGMKLSAGVPEFKTTNTIKCNSFKEAVFIVVRYAFGATDFIINKFQSIKDITINSGYLYLIEESKVLTIKASNLLRYDTASNFDNWTSCGLDGLTYYGFDSENEYEADVKVGTTATKINLGGIWSILSVCRINGYITSGNAMILYGSILSSDDITVKYLLSRISLGRETYTEEDLNESEKAELERLLRFAGTEAKPITLYSSNGNDFTVLKCDSNSGEFINAIEYLGDIYFFDAENGVYTCQVSSLENGRVSSCLNTEAAAFKYYQYQNYERFTMLVGSDGISLVLKNEIQTGMKVDYIRNNVIYLKSPITESSIGKSNVLVSFNIAKNIDNQLKLINRNFDDLYFNNLGLLKVREVSEVDDYRISDRAYISIEGDESLFGIISNDDDVLNSSGNVIKACSSNGTYLIGNSLVEMSNRQFNFNSIKKCKNILMSDTSSLQNEPAYFTLNEELTNSLKGHNIYTSRIYKAENTPAIKIWDSSTSFNIADYKSMFLKESEEDLEFVLRFINDNFNMNLTAEEALSDDSIINISFDENDKISISPFSVDVDGVIHNFEFKQINGLGTEKYLVHTGTNSEIFNHIAIKDKVNFKVDLLSTLFIKNEERDLLFGNIKDSKISCIYLNPKGYGGDRNNSNWNFTLPWDIDKDAFEEKEYLTNSFGDIVYMSDDSGNLFTGHKGNFEIAENNVDFVISTEDFNSTTKDITLYDSDKNVKEVLQLEKITKNKINAYTTYNDIFINGLNEFTLSFYIYRDWKIINLADCNFKAYFIDKYGNKTEKDELIGSLITISKDRNEITFKPATKEYENTPTKLRVYVSYGNEVVKVDYNILGYTTQGDGISSESITVKSLYTFLKDIDGNYRFTGINLNTNDYYFTNGKQETEESIFVCQDNVVNSDAELNSTIYPIIAENRNFKINDVVINNISLLNEVGNSFIYTSINATTVYINSPIIGIENIRVYQNYRNEIKYIVETEDYENSGLFTLDENGFVFVTELNEDTKARELSRLITRCKKNTNSILNIDNIYILDSRVLNVRDSKDLIISGVKGNIALRKPKFNNFYDLIYGAGETEGLGEVIDSTDSVATYSVKITDENSNPTILKSEGANFIFNKPLSGNKLDAEEVYDRLNDGRVHFLKIDFLTQKTYRYGASNQQDSENFIEIPLDEIDMFTPDRVWFNPNGYVGSPIKIGNDIYREENNYAYTNKSYKNNNGFKIFECNEQGKYISYYVDATAEDGIATRVLARGESIDKGFNPKKPKYESCKEWFKNKYYIEGENINPFWQVLKINSEYSQINKRWEQKCKLIKYEKLNNAVREVEVGDLENLVTYQKPYYYTVENGIINIDYEQDFVDTKNGMLKIILYQGNEMYKEKETLIKYGITAYNSFFADSKYYNGNAILFKLGSKIGVNSYLNSSYIVNSIENLANKNDKDAAIAEITEFGLFNKEHQLIAYGTFPPIEYRTDTQHVSFTCVIKNGAYSSIN